MSVPPTQQSSGMTVVLQLSLLRACWCVGSPKQYFVVGQSATVSQ
jgi:hypothetical protein